MCYDVVEASLVISITYPRQIQKGACVRCKQWLRPAGAGLEGLRARLVVCALALPSNRPGAAEEKNIGEVVGT